MNVLSLEMDEPDETRGENSFAGQKTRAFVTVVYLQFAQVMQPHRPDIFVAYTWRRN